MSDRDFEDVMMMNMMMGAMMNMMFLNLMFMNMLFYVILMMMTHRVHIFGMNQVSQ